MDGDEMEFLRVYERSTRRLDVRVDPAPPRRLSYSGDARALNSRLTRRKSRLHRPMVPLTHRAITCGRIGGFPETTSWRYAIVQVCQAPSAPRRSLSASPKIYTDYRDVLPRDDVEVFRYDYSHPPPVRADVAITQGRVMKTPGNSAVKKPFSCRYPRSRRAVVIAVSCRSSPSQGVRSAR